MQPFGTTSSSGHAGNSLKDLSATFVKQLFDSLKQGESLEKASLYLVSVLFCLRCASGAPAVLAPASDTTRDTCNYPLRRLQSWMPSANG